MLRILPLLPLLLLALLLHAISGDDLARELVFVGSGFLALLFGGALFVALLPLQGDTPLLLRKTLMLFLPLFLLLLLPGIWSLAALVLLGGALLLWLLPEWQELHEETVRLEPVFFLLVGVKVAIVALVLL